MEKVRKPFQGVWNIIRFNRHFYILSLSSSLASLFVALHSPLFLRPYCFAVCILILIPIVVSLAVSYFIYDLAGFYNLDWIDDSIALNQAKIITINAGFDETSMMIRKKFPASQLTAFDFHNPRKHTEISIKRARAAYPQALDGIAITTSKIPIADRSTDTVFLIFAAHEIRDLQERIVFFKEVQRILKADGQIIIVEHLRDIANFLAYNIGILHFYSRSTWLKVFQSSGLIIKAERKFTPFTSIFTVVNDGTAS